MEKEKKHRSARCGYCYWALYDGEFCMNSSCFMKGKPVSGDMRTGDFVYLTQDEAMILINSNASAQPPKVG